MNNTKIKASRFLWRLFSSRSWIHFLLCCEMVQSRGCFTSNLSAFGGNLMAICLIRIAGFIFTLRYKMVQSRGCFTSNLSAFGGNSMAICLIRKAGFIFTLRYKMVQSRGCFTSKTLWLSPKRFFISDSFKSKLYTFRYKKTFQFPERFC